MNKEDIKKILENYGWSQSEFAKKIGYAKSTITGWMQSEEDISEKAESIIKHLLLRLQQEDEYDLLPYVKYIYDIESFRKSIKKTQAQFGELIGVSQGYISLVEKGENKLSDEQIDKIREIYPSIDNFRTTDEEDDFETHKTIKEMKLVLDAKEETIASQKIAIRVLQEQNKRLEQEIESLKKDNLFSMQSGPETDENNTDKEIN